MKQYIKSNLHRFIISSLIILSPVPVGLLLWDRLSKGFDSWTDSTPGFRLFSVIIFPLILLALHWAALLITGMDNRKREQSKSIIALPFWIIPFISLFTSTLCFTVLLNKSASVNVLTCLLVGLGFVMIGNYMPKTRLNFTLGIKLRWTLANEENWYATHRFAGKLWMITGFLSLLCAFLPPLPSIIALISTLLASVVAILVYAFVNYQRLVKAGRAKADPEIPAINKKGGIATIIIICVLVIVLSVIMFTGRITVDHFEDGFYVDSTYGERIQVRYDEIDSVELRDDLSIGIKVYAFNSARLNVGQFQNAEFGYYTVYAYTNADEYLIIRKGDAVLCIALSGEDTRELYGIMLEKLDK